MIEVVKNCEHDKSNFPYIVKFNSKSQYFTKLALIELGKKIDIALNK